MVYAFTEFVEIERDTIYYSIDGFEIGFSNDGSIKYMHDPYTKVHSQELEAYKFKSTWFIVDQIMRRSIQTRMGRTVVPFQNPYPGKSRGVWSITLDPSMVFKNNLGKMYSISP